MGRSGSASQDRQRQGKKQKKDKKHKKQRRRQSNQKDDSPRKEDRERNKKQKRDKEKRYGNRSKSKSRERERSRQKQRQRNRQQQRQRQRQRNKQQQRQRERSRQKKQRKTVQIPQQSRRKSPSPPKPQVDQQDRARKIAMRRVKLIVSRFDNLDEDSDQSQKAKSPPRPPPVVAAPSTTQGASKGPKKRQSKWGKVSSNQPAAVPVQIEKKVQPQEAQKNLSLELQKSEDPLRLSQDKSIQFEDQHHDQVAPLESINQEEVDPLDQFMQEMQGKAVAQMDLAMRPKANIISFEDIVARNYVSDSAQFKANETSMEAEDQEIAQNQRQKFLQAIKNINQTKQQQKLDQRGTVMELNQENRQQLQVFQKQLEPQLDFFAKQRRMAQRKQLGLVDHSKIVYQDVKFNLYRQSEQVRDYDPAVVKKYRKEAGDIKVRGKEILNPVFNWYHCGYSDKVLSIIEKRQYAKPFPIQAQSMPLLLAGRDVIGIAQTGSGKTLAYLLPAIRHIQQQKRVQEGQGPISIIMTPTRQLARQVYIQAKQFCKPLGLRVISVYGGQSVQTQLSQFRQGAQLVVCTPGRMIDILTLNKGKVTNLRRVTFLVIDEADRMFDLGFEPQITRIIDNVRPKRQCCLFSATFPKNVQGLARKVLNKPVEVIVGSRGQACANVQQIVQVREQTSKLLRLLQILGLWHQKGSILVFVDKQTQADLLFQELLRYGYQSSVLHGAMDPDDREFTIYDFKRGVQTIMIATSVCARGLDIRSIVLVVNFKCPNHLQDYIHRIGRTGRGGNKGTAITFITPAEEQYSIDLLKALEMAQIHPPQQLIKLSQGYLSKVKKGQARKIRNRNIMGTGFKFDEDQQEKAGQIKELIKKQMKNQGLGFSDSDDQDIQVKKKKQQDMRNRNHQERIAEAIKNPQIKHKLLNEAVKAVADAIKQGSAITTQKLLQIAVGSMREAVTKHKVVNSANDGVEQVSRLIDQFANQKTAQGVDFFSYDFQINDYPLSARQKACNQQYLYGIQNQTNCSVSLRGVYVQPGKKAQVGCRKLYLHIQGQNKYYVTEAYKQIKQVLEQSAYESMHMGMAPGKYNL